MVGRLVSVHGEREVAHLRFEGLVDVSVVRMMDAGADEHHAVVATGPGVGLRPGFGRQAQRQESGRRPEQGRLVGDDLLIAAGEDEALPAADQLVEEIGAAPSALAKKQPIPPALPARFLPGPIQQVDIRQLLLPAKSAEHQKPLIAFMEVLHHRQVGGDEDRIKVAVQQLHCRRVDLARIEIAGIQHREVRCRDRQRPIIGIIHRTGTFDDLLGADLWGEHFAAELFQQGAFRLGQGGMIEGPEDPGASSHVGQS